jgi:hypothetical protein
MKISMLVSVGNCANGVLQFAKLGLISDHKVSKMTRSSPTYASYVAQPSLHVTINFFKRRLCPDLYYLVFLNVEIIHVAEYTRRLLKHPAFDTQAKRMGNVIRASHSGHSYWRLRREQEQRIGWIQ